MSFTDLDQGREILSRFSLPKSMKHSVARVEVVNFTVFGIVNLTWFTKNLSEDVYLVCLCANNTQRNRNEI